MGIFSLPVVAFAGLVGKDILLNTVTGTTRGILGILTFITASDEPGTEKIIGTLSKIDILHKINVLDSLVEDLKSDQQIPLCIENSVTGLHEILKKIHAELDEIKAKIKRHKDKWFYYWRTINAKENLKNLIDHTEILNIRTEMLMRLLVIPDNKLRIIDRSQSKNKDLLLDDIINDTIIG